MRKIWIVISVIVLFITGCTKVSYEDVISVESPNWTSDGKVVFIREKEVWKTVEDIGVRSDIVSDSTWLYEINADGSGRKNKGLLFDNAEFGGGGLSSVGDWVVFGDGDTNIWVVRRNGTGLQEVGEGKNPDFSPDASKIVYEKPDQGIWIMDRNGGNDHQIISDADARYPAWSPDDTLIGYLVLTSPYATRVVNAIGDSIKTYTRVYFYDWGAQGSEEIFVALWSGKYASINIYTDEIDSLTVPIGTYRCSPDGEYLIAEDSNGYFACNRDGYNRWYISP